VIRSLNADRIAQCGLAPSRAWLFSAEQEARGLDGGVAVVGLQRPGACDIFLDDILTHAVAEEHVGSNDGSEVMGRALVN
jgi:hypothetical protein